MASRTGDRVDRRASSDPAMASSQTLKKNSVGTSDVNIDQNMYAEIIVSELYIMNLEASYIDRHPQRS